jgi:hypothetical protein
MKYPDYLFEGRCVTTTFDRQLTFMQCVGVVLFTTLVLVLFV